MKTVNNTLRSIGMGVLCLLALPSITARAQIINTVAGTGTASSSGDGSAATSATLNNASAVAFDASGNMYIAEYSGNYVRKVSTSGTISTVVGTGTGGSTGDGSAATSATINGPTALAFDASGNMYIAEGAGNRVRKVNTSGTISTVVGTGTGSSTGDGSAATSATINFPAGLAFDGSGNLYVSENGGNRVRMINSSGTISTFAGTGTAGTSGDGAAATSAKINSPAGLAFDGSGNLYIAENGGNVVRKVTSAGTISTIAGTGTGSSTGDGSAATSATLNAPRGLAIDAAGNIFIGEENGYRIRRINTSGTISTIAGTGTYSYTGDGAAAVSATMQTPYGMNFSSGNLYLTDFTANRVRRICNAPTPTVAAVTYCQGATATALTATGTALLWYTTASTGTGSATAPVPGTGTVGTTTYYVTQTPTSFGCESPRIPITVTVNTTPAAPTVTSPVTYCSGVTATALTATKGVSADTLMWYTAATGGTSSLTAPTPTTTAAGTTSFYVSEKTPLACEGPRAAISVVVNPTPTTPTVTSPVTYCSGVTATALTATAAGTGDTLLWYTAATGGTGSKTAPVPSTSSAATTPYYVSEKTSLGCEGARSTISVVVNATPTTPTVTASIDYCKGAAAAALTATKASGADTLFWYTAATGGVGSTTAPTPSTATVGTVTYYVSEKTGLGCEGARTSIAVNTQAIPLAPTVTSVVNYCKGATATALTATKITSSDTLYWYTSAIGGSGTATAPTPSTATVGSTNYYVSERSMYKCEGPRSLITVSINPIPVAPTVTATVNYCIGATATPLTATAAGTGDTLLWYTAATGGTASLTAPTPATTATGTTSYYVSEKSSFGCEGPRAAIAVSVNPLATAPTVTTPVIYCVSATATALTATKGTSSDTLMWYTVATGGTASITAPVPSTATAGITTYYVSGKTNLGCESATRTALAVNVNPLAAAPGVTSPISLCQGSTAAALTATTGSGSDTLLWYTVATGGTGSKTAPTPATGTVGTTTYYVSAKTAAGCEGSRTALVVNVVAAPAAPTVTTPVNYCVGATATALTATGSNLLWYTAATGGTGATAGPIPVTTTAGTVNYYVTQTPTIGGCESPRALIAVVTNAIPVAPTVTSPLALCVGVTASALTATKATSSDSLVWYTAATGGTGSTTAPVPSTAAAGVGVAYVSERSLVGCEGPRVAIVDTVRAAPAKPTVVTPVIYCQNVTASAMTATGSNLKWYTVSTGGTSSSTVTPSTTAAGTTTYYVSQSLSSAMGGCESVRDSIKVTVRAAPAAPTVTSPVNLCVSGPASALTATPTSTFSIKWYTVATGGTGSATAPTPTTTTAGTTNYYVTQTDTNSCESPRATIAAIVNALPAAPTVTTPLNLCVSGTASTLTATGSNLLWYNAATGGTGSATAPTVTPGASASSTDYFVSQSLAASSGGCEGPRAKLTVVVNALPAAPAVTSPVDLCLNGPTAALTATGTSLLWYAAATGGTGSATAPSPATTATGTTSFYVTQTSAASSGSCESPRASISAIVHVLPVVSVASTSSSGLMFCVGGTITLKATAPTATSYQWTEVGMTVPGATADTFLAGSTGVNGYRAVWVKDVYGCKGADSVYVRADTTIKPVLDPVVATLCKGSSTMLYCHPGFSKFNFEWFKDGVDMGVPPTTTTKFISDSGTYYVVVTNRDLGCVTITNTAKVSYYPVLPNPVISRSGYLLSVDPTYTSYQWFKNTIMIPGANGRNYTTSSTGKYYVVVTDLNGCSYNSDTVDIVYTGITDPERQAINIYPNPSRGRVTVECPVDVTITVTDISGRVMVQQHEKDVDLGNFADGMYFFRVTDENNNLLKLEKINKQSGM